MKALAGSHPRSPVLSVPITGHVPIPFRRHGVGLAAGALAYALATALMTTFVALFILWLQGRFTGEMLLAIPIVFFTVLIGCFMISLFFGAVFFTAAHLALQAMRQNFGLVYILLGIILNLAAGLATRHVSQAQSIVELVHGVTIGAIGGWVYWIVAGRTLATTPESAVS